MQEIRSVDDFEAFLDKTATMPLLLLKHSTACPVSDRALSEYQSFLARTGSGAHAYLDILAHRPVSNQIASRSGVVHESPQVLLFYQGEVVWSESHHRITTDSLASAIQKLDHA